MNCLVVGHKTPDTDSIIGAISLSYLLSQIGQAAKPIRQGKVTPETQFILDRFGFSAPELQTEVAGSDVWLIDYSDRAQAPDDLDQATVQGIVDHHKLGDITTSAPLECWIRPVGCSNTIVLEMFDHHKVTVPAAIAGMMLCAILSDTVMFKSPTCTPTDIASAERLAKLAGIEDLMALGMDMFRVKSAIDNTPATELLQRDFKNFDMGGKKIGIGQLEAIDAEVFTPAKAALLAEMSELKASGDYHSVLLMLTDISNEGTELLFVSDDQPVIETAFAPAQAPNSIWLASVLSRKKQIIPPLQNTLAG